MDRIEEIKYNIKNFKIKKAYKNFKISLKKRFAFFTNAKKNVYYSMVKKEKKKNQNYIKRYGDTFAKFEQQKDKIQKIQNENNLLKNRIRNMEEIKGKSSYKFKKIEDENKSLKQEIEKLKEELRMLKEGE